jgi:CO/xanthine dehydrogenase Mo-binding subunit
MSALPANLAANPTLNRWVSFDTDAVVSLRTGKVEIGQGAVTAIAAIAARELGVDLDSIRMVPADTLRSPDEGYTAGSFSIEHGGSSMRWACALVRALFEQEARKILGDGELVVRAGTFMLVGRNEGVSYWELAPKIDLAQSSADLPAPVLIGGSVDHEGLRRLDLDAKLHGTAFIQDMSLPGMLYGRVLRGAHPADRLTSFDRDKVLALPGVVDVVVDGGFMGVVANRDEQALNAIKVAARNATWARERELPPHTEANGWMTELTPKSTVFINDDVAEPKVVTHHQADYSRPFIAHASIGPSSAVATWHDDAVTIWSHSQGIYPLQRTLAKALRIDAKKVRVIHAQGSGCYGHNGADDVALDAALLARGRNVPVMCMWSRADELSWSPFGAAMRMHLAAGLGDDGKIAQWEHDVWSPSHLLRPGAGDGVNLLAASHLAEPSAPSSTSDAPLPYGGGARNALSLYQLGKRRITHHLLPQGPLRSSALRSLGAHGNVFAIESFMDELAALANADPVEFRLRHLEDPRAIGVIQAAANRANWKSDEPRGEGIGRGFAFSRYKNVGCYFAVVATVEVTDEVSLKHVTAAIDAGEVVHRDGLLNQVEGGVVQAASWALKEEVRWTSDGFGVRSWNDYPILNFSETPTIDTVVVEPEGAPALGAGEGATGPIAAAIANAIHHALGIRVRDLPLTSERIAAAINSL